MLPALFAVGRDNARTPMQWDDSDQAGFTTGTAWLPVNPNRRTINAAAEVDDPESVFNHYRRLIALRHEDPVIRHGEFELLLPDDPAIYAFIRTLAGTRLLVVANFSGEPVDVPLDLAGEVVIGNYREPVGSVLRPWEARVYRTRANS